MDHGGDEALPSLSQLIYSQSSSQNQPSDGQNSKKSSGIKEQDLIDDFYGVASTSGGITSQAPAVRSHTPATAKRKLRRKKRRRTERDGGDWELETQAQADERERRRVKERKIQMTENRWKNRAIDMRSEVDVGGVYDNVVRKHWKVAMANEDDVENDHQQQEELSFWEQGFTAPAKHKGIPAPSQIKLRKKKLPPETAPAKYPYPLRQTMEADRQRILTLQHPVNCPISSSYFHQGTLARLAAQQLIISSGSSARCQEEEEKEPRYVKDILLKTLFKISHNHRFDALVTQVGEQGLNADVFKKHVWSDRAKAVKALLAGQQLSQQSRKQRFTTNREYTKVTAVRMRKRLIGNISVAELLDLPPEYEQEDPVAVKLNYDESGYDAHRGKEYRFIKGTEPPTPQLPLDEVDVEFGPRDQYDQALRVQRIPLPTSNLTMATLLSRLAAATRNDKQDDVVQLHDTITSFLILLRAKNNAYIPKTKNRFSSKDIDTPTVSQYLTLMQYCQYTANSEASSVLKDTKIEVDEEKKDVDEYVSAKPVNHRAEDISLVLAHAAKEVGLEGFPRLHFVCALSHVARELPSEAAMLFARHDDTPFNIVRRTLEFLERRQMFVNNESKLVLSENILPAHLEYLLYEAAEIIENRCLSTSLEIDYRAWLAALRLGSLLLCSGKKIDGTAFPYRSFKSTKENLDAYFSQELLPEMLVHEVRNSLPKYDESRLHAAEATRSFFSSSKQFPNSRNSELIVSVLEWSQAIAQMVGTGKRGIIATDPRWEQVRLFHARHSLEVASLNVSQLKKLRDVAGINRNDVLDKLAVNLESMPSNLFYWRALVKELGPLGSMQEKECTHCEECKRLRKGLNADHLARKESSWWGRQRASWWVAYLLRIPKNNRKSPPPAPEGFLKRIMPELAKEVLPDVLEGPARSDTDVSLIGYGWLDRTIKLAKKRLKKSDRKAKIPSTEDRNVSVDDLLPIPLVESISEDATACSTLIPDMDDQDWEMRCFKIFLAAHLCGADHHLVMKGVWLLACRVDTRSQIVMPKVASQCFGWLASQGLNIPQVLMDYVAIAKCPERRVRKGSRWSAEAKEQLKLARKQYGNAYSQIQENVAFFATWRRENIRSFYVFLKEKGEL